MSVMIAVISHGTPRSIQRCPAWRCAFLNARGSDEPPRIMKSVNLIALRAGK